MRYYFALLVSSLTGKKRQCMCYCVLEIMLVKCPQLFTVRVEQATNEKDTAQIFGETSKLKEKACELRPEQLI